MSLTDLDGLVEAGNQTEYQTFQVSKENVYLGCVQEYLDEFAEDIEVNGNSVKYASDDQTVEVSVYGDLVEISGEASDAQVAREIADSDNWLEARMTMWYNGLKNSS